jgi:DNA-directed RNA polymerase subunit K/omega
MTNPLKIAEKEYNEGVIPISIIRTLPGNKKVKIDILSGK